MYPDLVKVKVALDDGEICGVEAGGYLFNHTTRDNITPSISESVAKKTINYKIDIISSDIAVIPTEYNSEILTYEFKGKIDDREFLIYINANTGVEEKVLLIIDSKNQEKGVGLPIGNQTSQWFGLYYLDEIDRLIEDKQN